MASIDDLKNGSTTDNDGVLVIDNPNIRNNPPKNNQQQNNQHKEGVAKIVPKVKPAAPVREQVKPKRVAADLSSLPQDEPEGDIHESLEDDILKPGGPFEKYVERKTEEMQEINKLIDEHNEAVALARGEEVPTDEQLEEMGERGEATNNLTGVLMGTKYYDQSDAFGRGTGDIKESPLESKMKQDSALREEMLGDEKVQQQREAANKNPMDDDDEYIDPMEKEIEEEMGMAEETPVKPVKPAAPAPERKPEPAPIPQSKPTTDIADEDEEDIEPDENDTTISDGIEQVDEEESMKRFQAMVTEKIKPVTKKLNLSSFKIVKNPVSISANTLQANSITAMDWVLPNSKIHISMRTFGGQEMERLDSGRNANSFQDRKNQYKMLYDHVTSEKPDDLEKWLKSISFNDIDHLYFTAYGAGFAGSHFVPYDCTKCRQTFLSDNFPIESLYKYKDDEAKERCEKIRKSQEGVDPSRYVTEVIQISDDFAISFRDPSIWNALFETAILDDKFSNKYRTPIAIAMYIDEMWKIGDGTIAPVGYKIDSNNLAKTVKARVITYAKIINTLTADQYNLILAYLNALNTRSEDIQYIRPEVVCPNCGTVIPEAQTSGEELLFTRAQLAALSLTSVS